MPVHVSRRGVGDDSCCHRRRTVTGRVRHARIDRSRPAGGRDLRGDGLASPEIDAVVARSANHGFAPANVYDVYIPELDDENIVSIVDRMLGAVAPVVAGDDAVEFILYCTTYSEDPIVEFGPFNADAGHPR